MAKSKKRGVAVAGDWPMVAVDQMKPYPRNAREGDLGAIIESIQGNRQIIAASVRLLKQDRFVAFVVGDVRDGKGMYRNFPADTTAAFQGAGMRLYNEAVLITCVGSLPIRVGKQFEGSRKLGKTHQNVLVFVKGDPKKATEAIGPVECGENTPVKPGEPK